MNWTTPEQITAWFQSLFFWICRSDLLKITVRFFINSVSILVLLDMPFRPYGFGRYTSRPRLFQSLFFWICRSDRTQQPLRVAAFRVSILVLLDMPFRPHESRKSGPHRHVSILVLLDMPFRPEPTITVDKGDLGFNPCSSGYAVQTTFRQYSYPDSWLVSILVLLDMPFRQQLF
ncbi:uncharacterized protein TOL2_C29590 [Desulfobacula toluolica Tol2]|uniref:Uncharacterized protein n=1 Tax=Desulfobacula toluolica (strain DSM 7467 / Tol2) TaxID=651182 RepID=K0NM65_DESTT|nr:uncharacterized protein TOL2_C29590 [Desulfobacula toluolica Tol2]